MISWGEIGSELEGPRILKFKELIRLKPDVDRKSALLIVFAENNDSDS